MAQTTDEGFPWPSLAQVRRSYEDGGLDEGDVAADPLIQLRRWLDDALAAGIPEANAMVLATADAAGVPSVRTVLLKGLDERGLTFYTNYGSAKARSLEARPWAEVVFGWQVIGRQVRVAGAVARVGAEESAAYFASRPRDSQLGAWASRQSEVVADRAELDRAYAELARRWPEGTPIPLPEFWGGYRIAPVSYEFWQGRRGRLHDRLRYRWSGETAEAGPAGGAGGWVLERLAP